MKSDTCAIPAMVATLLCLPVFLLLTATKASASDEGADGNAADASARTPTVIVTANRLPRDLPESLSSVSVIDAETLERQQPRDVTELMQARPGVDVSSNGPYGKVTGVFMRGTNADQTLLLLDGLRMGSATVGAAAWQHLPPQLIERIEIVRGPRTSLYGADAVGGVVQLFTPTPADTFEPSLRIGGGSYASREVGGGVSGTIGTTRYNLSANYFDTDGIALREGGERKGLENGSGAGRITHRFDTGTEISLTALRSQGETEFIGGSTDFVQQAVGMTFDTAVTAGWDTALTLAETRDNAETSFEAFGDSRFDTRRRIASWQNRIDVGPHEVILGADHHNDRVSSDTDFAETSRRNTAGFGQALIDLAPVALELSLRYDDNEAYGGELTGGVAAGYALGERHRLRASYGTAFRAPSFNELHFPGFGNPGLDPETSGSIELGVSGHGERWFWDLAAYRTEIDDLIDTVFAGGGFTTENVARARIHGVELSAGYEPGPWRLYGAASFTDPENRDTGNRLRRRARESLRLELDREIGAFSLGATAIAQGARFEDEANTDRLSGFALFNLRMGWRFAERWSARLTVANLFDRDYATARDAFEDFDFRQPGRHGFLTLRYDGG